MDDIPVRYKRKRDSYNWAITTTKEIVDVTEVESRYLLLLLLLDLLMIGSKMDELQVRRTRPKLAYKK